MADLAKGLGVPIKVFHTSRRTSQSDRIADDLCKGKVDLVRQELTESRDVSTRVSKVMLMQRPKVNMELGRAVLMELSARPGLAVHVGMSYKTAACELGVKL